MTDIRIKLWTKDTVFYTISDVEVGKWARNNLELDPSLFASNSSIAIKDLRFKDQETLNLFKIVFGDRYIVEVI